MSASTGDVLYDRPFSFPPASIAFCRGRAKRDPSVGVFWIKSASFRQFQWRGESLGEARSAVGFVGNSPPVRASGLDQKSASPIQRRAAVIGRPFLDRLEKPFPHSPSFLAYPREIRPFLNNGLQGVEKSFLAPPSCRHTTIRKLFPASSNSTPKPTISRTSTRLPHSSS